MSTSESGPNKLHCVWELADFVSNPRPNHHQKCLTRYQQVHKHNEACWNHFRRVTFGFGNFVPVDFIINCLHMVPVSCQERHEFIRDNSSENYVQAVKGEIYGYQVLKTGRRSSKVIPASFIVFVNLLMSFQNSLMKTSSITSFGQGDVLQSNFEVRQSRDVPDRHF